MISLITVTCRQQTGFAREAKSIAVAFEKLTIPFEWVVIDELFDLKRCKEIHSDRENPTIADRRFPYQYVRIDPNPKGFPNPNRNRNLGIQKSKGDYLVFLDDNMVVSPGWLAHVAECRKNGWGFRSTVYYINHKSGKVKPERQSHVWTKMELSQCSGIFGAPKRILKKIGGFDESYAGEMKYEDLDCIARLMKAGLKFYGTRGSYAIHYPHPPVLWKNEGRNENKFKRLTEEMK